MRTGLRIEYVPLTELRRWPMNPGQLSMMMHIQPPKNWICRDRFCAFCAFRRGELVIGQKKNRKKRRG